MSDKCQLREYVLLRKKASQEIELGVEGRLRILKYRRGEDKPFEELNYYNTVSAQGFDTFIKLLNGQGGLDNPYGIGNAALIINPAIKTLPLSAVPQSANVQHPPTAFAYMWEFEDNTLDAYQPNQVQLTNGRTVFDSISINPGQKTNLEFWHFQLTIELYSATTAFATAGLDHMLKIFSGQSSLWIDSTNPRLQPYSDAGFTIPVGSIISSVVTTTDLTNHKITMAFTSMAGQNSGDWNYVKVSLNGGPVLRQYGCRANGSSCGTKAVGDEWVYTWAISYVQG